MKMITSDLIDELIARAAAQDRRRTNHVEVKQGPYDTRTAVDFAVWAPAEGAADVGRYVETLRNAKVGDRAAQVPPTHR